MKSFVGISILLLCFSFRSSAQTFENAGQYMDHISQANQALTVKYLFYLSGMSHGKSARKVEKRRQELLKAISDTRFDIMGMPSYKGDRTLKDTTVAYLKMLNSIFNEDYGKIVNMEEIAEQSYDLMEAYMLAKEKANEKLNEASKKQHDLQVRFAGKNNITLIDNESELETKMKTASEVMKHYNDVYLIFFKGYKQEAYMMDALGKKNIISIEQNINSLQKFAEEGLDKLKAIKGYNSDGSLIVACRNLMLFYKSEAAKGSSMTDFFLKEESFAKLKKQFDARSGSKRTQQDVDQFNKGVTDINAAANNFNAVNAELDKQRASTMNDWDKAVKRYMDNYIPVQQR
jgi:uncharacterized protein (DUF1697 family)